MPQFKPCLCWLLVLALTAGSGVVAGKLTNRWGTPPDMAEAAARLACVPDEFGEWRLSAEVPLEPGVAEMLECAGWRNRCYRNRQTGDTVSMAILLGPPGPISVHTPEICFSSQGHHVAVAADPRSYPAARESSRDRTGGPAPSPAAQFRKTTFDPVGGEKTTLIAYVGWCDGRSWQAPAHPRLAFGGLPYLYKLQLAAKAVRRPGHESVDPCDEFLRQFAPALEQAGFYAGERDGRADR
jgi:uncharacterized protein DUF3485